MVWSYGHLSACFSSGRPPPKIISTSSSRPSIQCHLVTNSNFNGLIKIICVHHFSFFENHNNFKKKPFHINRWLTLRCFYDSFGVKKFTNEPVAPCYVKYLFNWLQYISYRKDLPGPSDHFKQCSSLGLKPWNITFYWISEATKSHAVSSP